MNEIHFECQVSSARGANFIAKLERRTARIAVIGLGYVGLPLILGFHSRGLLTLGLDVDQGKIESLLAGRSYIEHIADRRIADMIGAERFTATTDFSQLAH